MVLFYIFHSYPFSKAVSYCYLINYSNSYTEPKLNNFTASYSFICLYDFSALLAISYLN